MSGCDDRRTFLKRAALSAWIGGLALRSRVTEAQGVVTNSAGTEPPRFKAPANACPGGIRGIRFSLNDPATAVVTLDMVEPLSARVAHLGWHAQFNIDGNQIVDWAPMLRRLPSAIVFDHMGHPPLPAGTAHPSHRVILELLDRGRTWVKLSGAYSNTRVGAPYPEATAIARAFVEAAPERLVWGSDRSHPTEPPDRKPNDAVLFDLLSEWAPDGRIRHSILVENPAALYGFAIGGARNI